MIAEENTHDALFCQPAVLPIKRAIPEKRAELFANLDEDYGTLIQRLFNCELEGLHKKFDRNYHRTTFQCLLIKYLQLGRIKEYLKKCIWF